MNHLLALSSPFAGGDPNLLFGSLAFGPHGHELDFLVQVDLITLQPKLRLGHHRHACNGFRVRPVNEVAQAQVVLVQALVFGL
jgi:hypothetical protein